MLSFAFVLLCILGGFLYPVKGECDVIFSDAIGTFSSPGYPSIYQPNVNCKWTFVAPIGMVVEILFNTVDLQESDGNSNCLDLIQVYDGDADPDLLISSFCDSGPAWPRPVWFLSTANRLTVVMETDMNVNNKTGFLAQYKQVTPRTEYIAAVAIDTLSIIRFNRFILRTLPDIPLPETSRPSALAFDPIESYFYYTDVEHKFIGRVKDDISHFDILIRDGIDYPLGIAVAYLTGLLYWTDVNRDEVSVSRLDGTFRKNIVTSNSGCEAPRGIVFRPDHQFVFWTCTNSIERAKADGSERQGFVVGLHDVRSLAIDPEGESLYWVNVQGTMGRVDRINIDGTNRLNVYQHVLFANVHGFVVDAFTFFWTHPGDRVIYYIERGDGTLRHVGRTNSPPMMEGLYYFNSDQYIAEKHQCAINNGGCMELCFPNGASYTCDEVTPFMSGCPSDITMSTSRPQTVSWVEPTALTRNNELTPVSLQYQSRSHSPGSTFFWGTTVVTYVFSDDMGNVARCVFSVILSGIIPPPVISNCPDDIERNTQGPQSISWQEPTAVSSGRTPVNLPYESRSHNPGSTFLFGTTTVTYAFADDFGNEVRCSFHIVLSELMPPVISNCPDNIEMTNEGQEVIYWQEPTAVSSGRITVNLPYKSRSHIPGTTFFWGTTTVTYVFSDEFGDEVRCSFNIILSGFVTTPTTNADKPSPSPSSNINMLFTEYLFFIIIGVVIIVVCLLTCLIISITCCCGCWQCNCKPKQRRPTTDVPMNNFEGNPEYMYGDNYHQPPKANEDYYATVVGN